MVKQSGKRRDPSNCPESTEVIATLVRLGCRVRVLQHFQPKPDPDAEAGLSLLLLAFLSEFCCVSSVD